MQQLAPSIALGVPRASLGAGLGCWIEHDGAAAADGDDVSQLLHRRLQAVPAWSLSPKSAAERICVLMVRDEFFHFSLPIGPPTSVHQRWADTGEFAESLCR